MQISNETFRLDQILQNAHSMKIKNHFIRGEKTYLDNFNLFVVR